MTPPDAETADRHISMRLRQKTIMPMIPNQLSDEQREVIKAFLAAAENRLISHATIVAINPKRAHVTIAWLRDILVDPNFPIKC